MLGILRYSGFYDFIENDSPAKAYTYPQDVSIHINLMSQLLLYL